MKSINKVVITIMSCVFLINTMSNAGNPQVTDSDREEFLSHHIRLQSLRQVEDINIIKKNAEEVKKKWSQRNNEYYGKLMLQVCASLRSRALSGLESYSLARHYALQALVDPNELSLETELELIGQITSFMITPNAAQGPEWAQQRKDDMQVRFHAWQRLEKAIDPNWDPNDLQSLVHPRPPTSVPWISGNPPEAIKDPKIRAEYEAALKLFNKKVESYNKQLRLRRVKRLFSRNAERYIVRAYSKPPFNIEELKQYLDNYTVEEKTKARILNTVTKNMQNKSQKMKKETVK